MSTTINKDDYKYMFKDLPEGQTHSYNDGCGEPSHNQREQGVYYDEQTAKQWGKCCEECHDVTFVKTYPAHTPYFACLNLNCKCHEPRK